MNGAREQAIDWHVRRRTAQTADTAEAFEAWLNADPENAEYAQYDSWADAVREYDGGVDAYWEALIEQNPNAAIFYNEVVETSSSDAERQRRLTGLGAFMAIMGIQPNAFAPNPTVTSVYGAGVYDPVGVANGPAQPQEERGPSEYEEAVANAP